MHTGDERRDRIVAYVHNYIGERGELPSYQAIARAVGLSSKGTVSYHLDALRKEGKITQRWEPVPQLARR